MTDPARARLLTAWRAILAEAGRADELKKGGSRVAQTTASQEVARGSEQPRVQ